MAFEYLAATLSDRQQQGLYRKRTVFSQASARYLCQQNQRYLNFASNDYLGLGQGIDYTALGSALNSVSSGALSSPLVSGYQQVHQKLEARLCELLNYPAALLFTSGFSANNSVLRALFPSQAIGQQSLIVQDKLNHASLIDGGNAAFAPMQRFNHNNMAHLASRLTKSKAVHKLVVSEGVFSMDGDTAPMAQLHALCQQHSAWLMLDDAHGFGVLNAGLGSSVHYQPDILVITFGKALASSGAAVLASQEVINLLLQFNREYTYSTGVSPLQAALTHAQLERLLAADDKRQQLTDNIALFRQRCETAGIALMPSNTPIQPIVLGDSETTLQAANQLKQQGIWLSAIRPPTVAQNTARLRITINAAHQREDIIALVNALEQCL